MKKIILVVRKMIPAALRNGSAVVAAHTNHSSHNHVGSENSSDEGEDSVYPYELMPLPTQLAGHGREGDGHRAILKRADGKLLKPVQPPPKGQREVDFYTSLEKSGDPIDKRIQQHVPEFFGVETITSAKDMSMIGDYLILRDIAEGFFEPNIIDVKIGARTYGPDASESKMAQEDSKYVGTKRPFGYSVTGMIVHSLKESGKLIKYDRSFGKDLKSEEVALIPETFFDVKSRFVPELMEIMIEQMSQIFDLFDEQRKYKMFASSLLLAYDAAVVKKYVEGTIDRSQLGKWISVRVIDFAHVFPAEGERDDNFLSGLENLLTLFKACLNNKE